VDKIEAEGMNFRTLTRGLLTLFKQRQKLNADKINMFWSGPPPSPIHWACVNSFVSNGFDVQLYSYDLVSTPRGVTLCDAREVVPREHLFLFDNPFSGTGDIAPFVDYFRLKLLQNNGGWYADMDTICLSADIPRGERIWSNECPDEGIVSNGILRFNKDDPVLNEMLKRSELVIQSPRSIQTREELGPNLITEIIREFDLPLEMGASWEKFYPISWHEVFKFWLPEYCGELKERTRGSMFVSLYNSWNVYAGFDVARLPPPGCYLREFLDRFLPTDSTFRGDTLVRREYDAAELRRLASVWLRQNEWAQEQLRNRGGAQTWKALLGD
jgi:hypothetical protein